MDTPCEHRKFRKQKRPGQYALRRQAEQEDGVRETRRTRSAEQDRFRFRLAISADRSATDGARFSATRKLGQYLLKFWLQFSEHAAPHQPPSAPETPCVGRFCRSPSRSAESAGNGLVFGARLKPAAADFNATSFPVHAAAGKIPAELPDSPPASPHPALPPDDSVANHR